jgi:hypothetical protein
MLVGAVGCNEPNQIGEAFGSWTLNRARSQNPGPERLDARFERHAKGEVFTLDRTYGNGQVTTSSTILYFDSETRPFEEAECLGTQSSRRLDRWTVEILRVCPSGVRIQLVRRLAVPNKITLEITESHPNGRQVERHLVLERQ